MMRPNIDILGRVVRGSSGVVLVLAGIFVFERISWLAVVLFLSGAFCIFEALRGWCALRACGIKTKL